MQIEDINWNYLLPNALNNEMEKHVRMTDVICVNDIRTTTLQVWSTMLHRTKKKQRNIKHQIQKILEQIQQNMENGDENSQPHKE